MASRGQTDKQIQRAPNSGIDQTKEDNADDNRPEQQIQSSVLPRRLMVRSAKAPAKTCTKDRKSDIGTGVTNSLRYLKIFQKAPCVPASRFLAGVDDVGYQPDYFTTPVLS